MKQNTTEEQETNSKFRNALNEKYGINFLSEDVMEFIEQLITDREKELLEKLYQDLNFHHVAKRTFTQGDWDDGVHHAIDLVQREIVNQIRKLASLQGQEKKKKDGAKSPMGSIGPMGASLRGGEK